MKVTVFFGHHKVGSTALQDFFVHNYGDLANNGILYPMVDFQGMSVMLANAFGAKQPFTNNFPMNVREPHNALAFKMLGELGAGKVPPYHKQLPHTSQMFNAIRRQAEYLEADNIVFISEVMANFGAAPQKLIGRLRREFPDAEFTFIACLRRVDDYIMSWHSQRLRFGHHIDALDEGGIEEYFGGIHLDYELMVKPWMDTFPEAMFILRNHADVMQAGGSVEDFKQQSNLSYPSDLVPNKTANRSYHRAVFDIARRATNSLPPRSAQAARRFLELVTPNLDLPSSSSVELLGQNTRNVIYERFKPAHEFLSRATGNEMFFPDFEEVRVCRAIPYREASDMVKSRISPYLQALENVEARLYLESL